MALMRDDLATRLRRKLLHRIHARYATRTETVDVGGISMSFTRIENPDRVLDEVAEQEDLRERLEGPRARGAARPEPLHLPYWAELWDSALGVGQWLVRNRDGPEKLRVLDLGCGMGLAGSVAARLGHAVLLADLEPAALMFAALNSAPWHTRVRCRRVNWRSDNLGERFNLILGSDILYERSQWEYLEPFWRGHLSEDGTVLLGEPGRQTGEQFIPWIQQQGWKLRVVNEPVVTRSTPIRLMELMAVR